MREHTIMKLAALTGLIFTCIVAQAQNTRLENLHGKTILLFTPHPDDDVFGAGGTIALLNRNQNKLYIVIYTNDDKGSYDPEMTSQHLAQIRKAEEEVSEGLLGTPQETNYYVNIDAVADLKFDAAAKQVSQFEPAVNKYRPDWQPADLAKAKDEMRREQPKKDGHYVEAFRYATGFVQY